ncbi:MAG: hypothetical protein ACK587_02615 [Cyanobacteriota bacterium]
MELVVPQKLHFLVRHKDGQWIVACLDFDLAAQDDTFLDAKARIDRQIESYIKMATEDPELKYLLSRKAPLTDWIVFHAVSMASNIASRFNNHRDRMSEFLSAGFKSYTQQHAVSA